MSKHQKYNLLAWVALGLTGFLLTTLMYWSLVPFKPILEIPGNKLNVVNENNEVKAGDNLLLKYHVCKRGNMVGNVTRYLEDNQVITLPDVNSKFPEGCNTYTIPVMIPINAPTDTYTFHAQATYEVSPTKTVTYDFYTDEFRIIGKIL